MQLLNLIVLLCVGLCATNSTSGFNQVRRGPGGGSDPEVQQLGREAWSAPGLFISPYLGNSPSRLEDFQRSVLVEAGKIQVSMCAGMCFRKEYDNATYFTYEPDRRRCSCRTAEEDILFNRVIYYNEQFHDKAMDTCAEWCYQAEEPTTVGYVFFERRSKRCFCRNNQGKPILNIYLDDLEKMKGCYSECAANNTTLTSFHYDTRMEECDCEKQ